MTVSQPVKLFEKWFNVLMFAYTKTDFDCMILNFWGDGTFDQRFCQLEKSSNYPNDSEQQKTSTEQWLSSTENGE